MKKYCILAIVIFIYTACTHGNTSAAIQPETNEAAGRKTDSFFPVTSFIKGQIITLDSLPVTPLQITTVREKADSVWIPKEKLKPLLEPISYAGISETNLTKYFKETSFNDQTLNAVTLTYDPVAIIPDSINLQHWNVYIDPVTGKVSKVYIVKNIRVNNQKFIQQLTWKTDKQARISTIINKPDGSMELLKEVVFVWDFSR